MEIEPREAMKTCHSSNSVSIIRITILGCYAYLSIWPAGRSEEGFLDGLCFGVGFVLYPEVPRKLGGH
jgi:hypothetical protein